MAKRKRGAVYLIRGTTFDPIARQTAEALIAGGADKVVAVLDTDTSASRQPASGHTGTLRAAHDCAPFDMIAPDDALLQTLGLTGLPENRGWFCGDLCYYAARLHLPDVLRFVLIESDVVLTGAAAARLHGCVTATDLDLVAPRLGLADRPKRFSAGLATLGLDPRLGCLFQVTTASARGVDAMLEVRRESLAKGVAHRVNDEAVLAAAAQSHGVTSGTAEDLLGDLLDPALFDTNPPHMAEAVMRAKGSTNDRILHPVVALPRILDRIASGEKAYSRHRLRRVLASALPEERKALTAALDAATLPADTSRPTTPQRGDAAMVSDPVRQAGATDPSESPARLVRSKTPVDRISFLFDALQIAAPIRVLDIGANPLIEGDAPYAALLAAGHAEVWGFEPQPDALAQLQSQRSAAETYLPHALGDGTVGTLHITRAQGFTSLFAIDPASARHCRFTKATQETGRIEVATRRLDDLDEIPEVDLLKIDVQGAETSILRHGRTKLRRALVIITEARVFPLYKGEPRFGDLDAELHAQGFEFLRFLTLKHTGLSRRHRQILRRSEMAQAVDGDAVYLRDLRGMNAMADAALARMAIIADGVIDNADLTLALLERLEDRGRISADIVARYVAMLPRSRLRSGV